MVVPPMQWRAKLEERRRVLCLGLRTPDPCSTALASHIPNLLASRVAPCSGCF